MGYSIKARRPQKDSEPVFGIDFFLWLPLWQFVCREAGDILAEDDGLSGYGSSGHSITATKARALAARLTVLLNRGVVGKESKRHMEKTRRERQKPCRDCKGTRRTPDEDGKPERCFECKGTGRRQDYPLFRTRWVREFRDFCRGSGGFRIC